MYSNVTLCSTDGEYGTDGYKNGMEESIVATFYFVDDNFKIIGGSAGDNLKFKETFIFIGNKRVHSAVIS